MVNGIGWKKFLDIRKTVVKELLIEFLATFNFHKLRIDYDREDTLQFRLGGIVHSMSILDFGINCGFYDEEVLEDERYLTYSF